MLSQELLGKGTASAAPLAAQTKTLTLAADSE